MNFERKTCSYFVKGSGTKHTGYTKTTYFYCNRSGYFKSKSKGKRILKTQGSSKLNAYCTAGIQLYHLTNHKLKAIVSKTHYGHTCSLGHIPLPQDIRHGIAGQLAMGVHFDSILDKVRNSVGNQLERTHLIMKKDLYNIEKAFKLRGDQRHSDDATSVRIWIEELKDQDGDNPVRFYKPQGQKEGIIGHNIGLDVHDFAIVIQTPLQAEMLRGCGNNNVVCVDATHGTNTYDFQLITILVMDEFGEGFPAGWCISNKEDHILLSNFYRHVRQHTGSILPMWFMSDDAEQYYTAWTSIFGGQPKKLLCTWHVDRAWRKALTKISNKQLQVDVYHKLRVILEEKDADNLHLLLQNTILQWNASPATINYASYFTEYYSQRYRQWAMCYRKGSGINTNMFAEAFHRVLKVVYLKGIVNKRMDACINTLLRYARDKIFDRLVKVEKGKSTGRLQAITTRHKTSLKLSSDLVNKDISTANTWRVKSATGTDTYTVRQESENCPHNCLLRCRICPVCIHQYSCT